MIYSNLYKQLKRRLRMRKRWLTLGAYILLAGAAAAAVWLDRSPGGDPSPDLAAVSAEAPSEELGDGADAEAATAAALDTIRSSKGVREVFLHKQYVCGEETQQFGSMSNNEIVSLYKEHSGARVVLDEGGKVHLVERIEDLAPKCRENAYFGLDKNGNLSLFDGMPDQDRVIRTFFQLDVQHMKSSLPQDAVNQLYSGIRVTDLADYNSVLSTFSEYASAEAAPAAKPQP